MEIKKRELKILLFFAITTFLAVFAYSNCYIDKYIAAKWDFAAMAVFSVVAYLLYEKSILTLILDKVTILLCIAVIYMFIRSVLSTNMDYELYYYVMFIALYFFSKSWRHDYIPHIFIFGAVAQSVLGIVQYYVAEGGAFQMGIVGSFDNLAGYTACLALVYPLCFLLLNRSRLEKILAFIAMAVIIAGIILSGYRTAILSIVVVSIIYVLASIEKRKLIYIAASIVLIVGVVGSFFLVKTDSIYGRLQIWKISCYQVFDNFIFGGGYRSFRTDYMTKQGNYFMTNPDSPFAQLADNVQHSFNEYIKLFIEYGLIGLLLILLLMSYLLVKCKKNNPHLLCLISLSVFSFFSYPFSYPFTLLITAYCLAELSNKFPAYRLRLDKIYYKPLVVTILSSLCAIVIYNWASEKNFKRVYLDSYFGKRENLITDYNWISNEFFCKAPFYYSYAVELKRDGEIDSSLIMIKKCQKSINDYDVNNLMGELYMEKGDYKQAEYYFQIAKNMIPNRFYPLSQLLRIYDMTHQKGKGTKIAKEILSKKVKVSSLKVIEIQDKAQKYMKNGHL